MNVCVPRQPAHQVVGWVELALKAPSLAQRLELGFRV